MWVPLEITIKNLFSYQDVNFKFNKGKTTLVYGVNKSDQGAASNGSGKSSLIDSISLSITGDTLRDINKKDIIRNNEKSGEVEIILSNKILSKEIKIIRRLHVTKSTEIEIWENNILRSDLKDMHPKESDKAILEYLDISKDDINNYYLISKGKYVSFFLSNDSSKKEVINRFSKANIIDPIDDTIKTDLSVLDKTITTHEKDESVLLSKLEIYKQQLIDDQNNDIELLRQDTISKLDDKILNSSNKINLLKTDLNNTNTIIDDLKTKLSTISSIKEEEEVSILSNNIENIENDIRKRKNEYNEIEEKYKPDFVKISEFYNNIENDILNLKQEQKDLNRIISDIEKNISDEIECPKCTHKFILRDKSYNVEEAKESLPNFKKNTLEITEKINLSNEKLIKLDDRKIYVKDKISNEQIDITNSAKLLKLDLNRNESLLTDLNNKIKNINLSKLDIERNINSNLHKIESINNDIQFQKDEIIKNDKLINIEKDRIYESKSVSISNNIDTLNNELSTLSSTVENIRNTRKKTIEWQLRFKKFKSFLANNSISSIQTHSNYYLSQMKTNLTTMIDGFRELSSGKMKEEITILVSRDGLNGENFNKFSGGEKSKCDLSCIFAMQKLINMTSKSGGLDLIFIDEVLESIDSDGIKDIVNSLSNLNQTIMMITHVDPDNYFECDKLIVEKTNGYSLFV